MMRSSRWLSALLLAAAAATAGAQTNVLVNGSFEQPTLSVGEFAVVSSIPGWTTTSGSGIEVQNQAVIAGFQGSQIVELDGNDNSGMQQVAPTEAGVTYTLSIGYSPRPGFALATNGIEVRVNGVTIDTIAQDGRALSAALWTRFAYPIVAAGTSTTIELVAVGTSDGVGGLIDDVRLTTPGAAPVPALSSNLLALLALLLAALSMLARRRPTTG